MVSNPPCPLPRAAEAIFIAHGLDVPLGDLLTQGTAADGGAVFLSMQWGLDMDKKTLIDSSLPNSRSREMGISLQRVLRGITPGLRT